MRRRHGLELSRGLRDFIDYEIAREKRRGAAIVKAQTMSRWVIGETVRPIAPPLDSQRHRAQHQTSKEGNQSHRFLRRTGTSYTCCPIGFITSTVHPAPRALDCQEALLAMSRAVRIAPRLAARSDEN